MAITTITIGGNDYVAYASVAEADAYLAVDPVHGPTWAALATDAKGSNLVAATRRLDLLNWAGSKASGDDQEEQWPRTGVTYRSGGSVPDDEVPLGVERATIILAAAIAADPELSGAGTSGSNAKRVKAGTAEVEFFRQQTGVPLQDETAYNLVREFLQAASMSAAVGPMASGTDGESSFADGNKYGRLAGYP
ncbi:hypothetical protein ELZ19_06740 [Brucella abortus]|uniref:DnaT-like ssDNA-binding protein n=1 Tax=Brucella abortus TaxID=235 RepID=UPI0004E96EBC|nr:DnaT-like ssDNA-binding protein [Brucella abortus]KFH18424.1 hypothetical protein IB60_17090 [Brucella abortus LMN1]RUQ67346.1 hypothetical protein ELZ23_15575 [Brucella abortus]RUQ78150.1 hypothetical protein ELZ22_17300 [Brucella abortus]RUQ88267.1 hypothetical protein ELZ18_15505 [Brucella abortus]RUQ90296.1 hypothetical protein ELZ20_15500 [Brucella abortus]